MDITHAQGCLIGMALGDALGAPTEFLSIDEILSTFPPHGIQAPIGDPARVTDDTQMALAVGRALIAAGRPYTPEAVSRELVRAFIDWLNDPENDRAPGMTCITACEALEQGNTWRDATRVSSKGCGANMRVMPVALLNVDAPTRAALAQLQAAITHGHPTALAASDLTAFVIAELGTGSASGELLQRTRAYALRQREVYYGDCLGGLWERAYISSTPEGYCAYGWDECLRALDRVQAAVMRQDRVTDPCLQTGAGWIAEEAFATALFCFLLYPDDPTAALRRAALTSGDSDSIAAITGAFAGAYHGIGAWSPAWIARVEYRDQLLAQAAALIA